MQQLLLYDRALFKLINYQWHNNFFDWLMPWLRNAPIWAPLYIFLIGYTTINYKKNGWWWVLFFICTVILSNYISSNLIKENIMRLRPCNEPAIASWVRVLVGYPPQSSSFTSSHAANHFAMAMFIFITLKKQWGKWGWLFFSWAFSISYAQMYVGVHYPIDITCGAIIGLIVGYLTSTFFNKNYALL